MPAHHLPERRDSSRLFRAAVLRELQLRGVALQVDVLGEADGAVVAEGVERAAQRRQPAQRRRPSSVRRQARGRGQRAAKGLLPMLRDGHPHSDSPCVCYGPF